VPQESERVEYFRRKCLGCHAADACAGKPAQRLRAGNNCIACHMPKNAATDVQHAEFTDHSIPRRGVAGMPKPDSKDCAIVPFDGTQATERDLALAYAQSAIEEKNSACETRAFGLLRKVEPLNPRDPAVLVQLAYLYERRSMEADAMSLYERALTADPGQITAAINLGAALSNRGGIDRAMLLWKDALARSPGSEAASLNLALAQIRIGDTKAADASLTRALQLSPGSRMIRKLLGELRRAMR
jgi:tetratricopeptide (TPR) repeat protein